MDSNDLNQDFRAAQPDLMTWVRRAEPK